MARTPDPDGPLRVGCVMEQVLGHVSHYQTLRRGLEGDASLAPRWVEVTYRGDGLLERTRWVPAGLSGTLRGYRQVRAGLRGGRLDALYFHTHKPAVFQLDLLARYPTVLSLDVTPRQYDQLGEFYDHRADRPGPLAALKHALNVLTFARARRIVVWSRWVRDSLVADYGVPTGKIAVIPPGVDLDLWRPPGERPEVGLPRILFVGGDFERKGGPLLLEWYRQHGRGRCELDLVTRAGVPPEPGVAVHRGLQPNTPELRALFHRAALFALPSQGECFGIAAVEALAAGLPVVMTAVGGAADIVEPGRTGALIPPADPAALDRALAELLDDPARRADYARAALATSAERFDYRRTSGAVAGALRTAARTTRAWRWPRR